MPKQSERRCISLRGSIKTFSSSFDASGDRVGKVSIVFRPDDAEHVDVFSELNKLMAKDGELYFAIMEKPE